MTATVGLAFLIMLIIVAAMAVGVLFGRQPISGSCGGMKALGMDVECEICGGNPALCDSEEGVSNQDRAGADLGFEVVDRSTKR